MIILIIIIIIVIIIISLNVKQLGMSNSEEVIIHYNLFKDIKELYK